MSRIPTPLIILELANNHMGDIEHGKHIIWEFGKVCKKFPFAFAFKLQYRDLDTYIHPDMKGRDDIKYVKRFSETRLTRSQFDSLIQEMKTCGFLTMATPFDEVSVGMIESQNLDFLKVASCSFTDWPLLEKIVKTKLPLIASTAGASLEDIDRVVSFFMHREKDFAILHCVGEYPTPDENMHLSQIDLLRTRYHGVRIGLSSHESPENTDNVKIAAAKGATVFEKHVGVATDKFKLNEYSCDPEQFEKWLSALQRSVLLCGNGERILKNKKEAVALESLKRGAFAKNKILKGSTISTEEIFFAFPPEAEQYKANDWSKYRTFTATKDIEVNQPVFHSSANVNDVRDQIGSIGASVKKLLKESQVVFPGRVEMEISHHYGLEKFSETGLTMLTLVNRGYCKKLLILLPGQNHPEQFHKKKEESFLVLYGEIQLKLNGETRTCRQGDLVTIEPETRHAFSSTSGAVIEEISLTHFKDDSFYTDEMINKNKNRKTLLTYWMES